MAAGEVKHTDDCAEYALTGQDCICEVVEEPHVHHWVPLQTLSVCAAGCGQRRVEAFPAAFPFSSG